MDPSPEETPSTFGVNPEKGTDPGMFYHIFLHIRAFFDIFVNYSENNVWILMEERGCNL